MCGAPPASRTSQYSMWCPHPSVNIWQDVQNWNVRCPPHHHLISSVVSLVLNNYQTSYQLSCQSSSTCISECGTSSWACYLIKVSTRFHLNSSCIKFFFYSANISLPFHTPPLKEIYLLTCSNFLASVGSWFQQWYLAVCETWQCIIFSSVWYLAVYVFVSRQYLANMWYLAVSDTGWSNWTKISFDLITPARRHPLKCDRSPFSLDIWTFW